MRYYAVIDTNVLVSALLRWRSLPGAVVTEALEGRITPLLEPEIMREYRAVLARPKFHFPVDAVEAVLDGLVKRGLYLEGGPDPEEELPDPKDTVFYRVVLEARKTEGAYLVTGNLKHFPVKSFVVTPREMLEILGTDGEWAAENSEPPKN